MCLAYFRDLVERKKKRRERREEEGGRETGEEGGMEHRMKAWQCHIRVKAARHHLKCLLPERKKASQMRAASP